MASTEKNANTFDMTSLSAVNSGYSLMLINNSTNEGQLITMTDLATMILNEIRNQTFTAAELGQSTAATLVGAISGLNSAMMPFACNPSKTIPDNSDINDFTEPGSYYRGSNTNIQSLVNCPASYAFRLDVLDFKDRPSNGKYIYAYQEIVAYNAPTRIFRRWIRTDGSGNWSYGSWFYLEGVKVES